MASPAGKSNQRGPGLSGSVHEEALESIFEDVEGGW